MICGIYMLNFKNLMFAKWNDNLKRLHCYMPTRPYAPKSVVPSPYEPQRKTLLNSQRKKPLYDWCIQSIFFFFHGVHAFFFQLEDRCMYCVGLSYVLWPSHKKLSHVYLGSRVASSHSILWYNHCACYLHFATSPKNQWSNKKRTKIINKYAIVFMRDYPDINRNHQNLCEKLWCFVRFETIIPLKTSGWSPPSRWGRYHWHLQRICWSPWPLTEHTQCFNNPIAIYGGRG